MYSTTYHRASSVDEAATLFGKGTEAKYLAGGQTLLPVMRQRLAAPSDVIDLSKIKDMVGIIATNNGFEIKGATTHYDVAQSNDVKKAIPGLAYLASVIGDPAVRYKGTIGGSLANNDPAADYPAAVLALNATVKTNKRTIPADEFFKGLFTTALADGEIITAVSFPVTAKSGYAKFRNPASRFALTAVFVAKTPGGDVRVAATGASQNGVMRVSRNRVGTEGKLVGRRARQCQGFDRRHAQRHPRHSRLPRQSGQGDGAARGGRGWLAPGHKPCCKRRAPMRAVLRLRHKATCSCARLA